MKTNIKGTGIELTPAISSYAEKRLSKITKFLSDDPLVSIKLGKMTQHHKHGEVFRAEIRISGSGQNYYASKEATDLYAAIDEVQGEVMQEITKDKGKRESLMRRGGRAFKDTLRGFPWFGRGK